MPARIARNLRFMTASTILVSCASLGTCGATTLMEVMTTPITPQSNFSVPPSVQLVNDGFLPNEAGTCPTGQESFCQLASLDDTFTGPGSDSSDATARQQFRSTIGAFMNSTSVQYTDPGCTNAYQTPSGLRLFTHVKAYEINQASFLAAYQQYTGLSDFLPAASRKMNSYTGNQKCPLVKGFSHSALLQSLGSLAYFTNNGVVLMTDNRYNPWRWVAPINAVHHHEQPSLSLMAYADPVQNGITRVILANSLQGDTSKRILLSYDLTVTVDDYRRAMGEYSFSDMVPSNFNSQDLFSTTARDVQSFEALLGPGNLLAPATQKYFQARYAVPSIQLSLAVVWQNNGVRWHDTEFMLAGKNYLPGWTPAFAPIADRYYQQFAVEGGDSGPVAWARVRLDGLSQNVVNRTSTSMVPIRQGGTYYNIPDGHSSQHLTGVIDLTDYYRFAMASKTFPGVAAVANGVQVSSLDPSTGQLQSTEQHSVNVVGVIYEVHGPYAIKVQVNKLDVQILSGTPTMQAASSTAGALVGFVDGLQMVGSSQIIAGWACTVGRADRTSIAVYSGLPYPEGKYLGTYQTLTSSETGVETACADPLVSPHRFQVPMTSSQLSALGSTQLYFYALSSSSGQRTLLPGWTNAVGTVTPPSAAPSTAQGQTTPMSG